MMASSVVNGSMGGNISSGQGDSHLTRSSNFGTCAPKQLKVLDALLMELHLGRESLGATQLRSWDTMVEEASHEGLGVMAKQLAKESLEMNIRSGSSTPLSPTRSLCVADHLPSDEDI
jgi:hypothetical protein